MKKVRNGENLKNFSKKAVCVLASLSLVASGLMIHKQEAKASYSVDKYSVRNLSEISEISYSETLNNITNPGIGFYSSVYMNLTENGDEINDGIGTGLRHFRVDISHFSPYYREKKGLGKLADYHINEKALDALRAKLQKARDNHLSVVIRFAYDPKFDSGTSFEPEKTIKVGGKNVSICDSDLINQHQEDLSGVLHEYKDVIVALEAGLIGQWGEMHSSQKCLIEYDESNDKVVESPVHYNKVISKWLELLDDTEISVLIRKMEDYINFANANGYKTDKISHSNVGDNIPTFDMKEYKLGFFNDSYLGSVTDRGTFSSYETRETAIKWLKSQTKHTLYGGEMAIWHADEKYKDVERFNTLKFITKEAFDTHTSYLNSGWNKQALDQLKGVENAEYGTEFNNSLIADDLDAGNYDSVYEGQNGYVYLRNHMGYRYVAKGVKLTKETTNYENFGIEVKINNVGFANIVRSKKLKLIMESESGKTYSYSLSNLKSSKNESVTNGDVIKWASDDKNTSENEGLTTFKAQVDLDDEMPNGTYKVYLRIADSDDTTGLNGYPVRFANKGKGASSTSATDKGIWNESLGANFLGSFKVVDRSTIETESKVETESNIETESNAETESNIETESNVETESVTEKKDDSKSDDSSDKKGSSKPKKTNELTVGKEFNITFGKNKLRVRVVAINGNKVKLRAVKILKNGKKVVIPGTFKNQKYSFVISEIGDKAFYKCKAKSITISKYIRKIGKKAFYGMKKCKTLIIKSNKLKKKNIKSKAFAKMNKKIKVKTNSKKLKKYKKLLRKRGISKKAKFKRL